MTILIKYNVVGIVDENEDMEKNKYVTFCIFIIHKIFFFFIFVLLNYCVFLICVLLNLWLQSGTIPKITNYLYTLEINE